MIHSVGHDRTAVPKGKIAFIGTKHSLASVNAIYLLLNMLLKEKESTLTISILNMVERKS